MRYVLAIALLLAPSAFAKAPTAACLNQCELRKGAEGLWEVACHCDAAHLHHHLHERGLASSSFALPEGAVSCAGGPAIEGRDSLEDLRARASQATRPLCECAATRTHFALNKSCEMNKTGETFCWFQPDLKTVSLTSLRDPSREDYQACYAAKENYRRPESCAEVPACSTEQPSCGTGKVVTNIADPEACCPVFVCQSEMAAG